MTQEVLLYDVVHDYIISENFASDTEGANKVMLKLSDELMQEIYERTMTASEKRKDTMLKKKYDDSDMKKNMQAQYGKEEGKKVYFATIRKQAMKKEEVEQEDPSIKAKMKRQAMIKKQVLMKKLQAVRAGAGADITSSHKPEGDMVEAKYEAGASTYGKASIRNKRRFGTKGENPDPLTGKKITKDATRGELIAKRREEHKAKRGVSEATRYAKETGKSFKSGKPMVKGGTAKDDKAFQYVAKKYAGQMMGGQQQKKVRGQKPDESNTPFKRAAERMKKIKMDNKTLADKAKKAGYKSTQDYVNVQAVRKGGLGT